MARTRTRSIVSVASTGVLVVALGTGMASPVLASGGEAPGAPGKAANWDRGDKDGFGTARGTSSKVWYTLRDGALSEIYYPRIDTPSTRDTQLVVSDGSVSVKHAAKISPAVGAALPGTVKEPCHVPLAATGMFVGSGRTVDETWT